MATYTDQDLFEAARQGLQAGMSPAEIAQRAVSMGIPESQMQTAFSSIPEASQYISAAYQQQQAAPAPAPSAATQSGLRQAAQSGQYTDQDLFAAVQQGLQSGMSPDQVAQYAAQLGFPESRVTAALASVPEATPYINTAYQNQATSTINDIANQYLGRDATPEEIAQFAPMVRSGQLTPDQMTAFARNMAGGAMQGWYPSYGAGIEGVGTLPQAPTLTGTAPQSLRYGQTVLPGRQPLTNLTAGQQAVADVISRGAYTDQDLFAAYQQGLQSGETPQELASLVAQFGVPEDQARRVFGSIPEAAPYLDAAYQGSYNVPRYGEDVAGLGMARFDEIVTQPMENWQYEQTPGFQTKQQLAQQDLQTRMANRGLLRGQNAANAGAQLTQQLVSQDYNTERDFAINNAVRRYQALGQDYQTAYANAEREYVNALNSENQGRQLGYTQGRQNVLDQYNLQLGQYTSGYNARAQEASNAYNELLNAARIGQGAAASTTSVGQNFAQQGGAAMQAAGTAAQNAALMSGQVQGQFWSGLGQVGPQAYNAYTQWNQPSQQGWYTPSTTQNTGGSLYDASVGGGYYTPQFSY